MKTIATAVLLSVLGITAVLAHGGGLDRYGCHTQSATGWYHCH